MVEDKPPEGALSQGIQETLVASFGDFLEHERSVTPQGEKWHPSREGVERGFTFGFAAIILGTMIATDRSQRRAQEQQSDSELQADSTETGVSASKNDEAPPQTSDLDKRDDRLLEVCESLLWQSAAEFLGTPSAAHGRSAAKALAEDMERLFCQTLGAARGPSEDGSDPPVET